MVLEDQAGEGCALSEPFSEKTIIAEQREIAIYEDDCDRVVIRQGRGSDTSEIFINKQCLPLVLEALQNVIAASRPKRPFIAKDRTAAERQRRYRARRRAGLPRCQQSVARNPASESTVVRYDAGEIEVYEE